MVARSGDPARQDAPGVAYQRNVDYTLRCPPGALRPGPTPVGVVVMFVAAVVIALGVLGCAAVVAQGPAPVVAGMPAEPVPHVAPATFANAHAFYALMGIEITEAEYFGREG